MEQKYAVAGIEPPLQELNDRIAPLIRRRDSIELADVRRAVWAARLRLAGSVSGAAGAAKDSRAADPSLKLSLDVGTDGHTLLPAETALVLGRSSRQASPHPQERHNRNAHEPRAYPRRNLPDASRPHRKMTIGRMRRRAEQ